jgi:thiosulfate reductase cytochrome b subunit
MMSDEIKESNDGQDRQADEQADAAVHHSVAEALPLVETPKVDDAVLAEEPAPVEAAVPVAAMVAEPEAVADPVGTLTLEKKHPLAIRWMHWINFPVLFTMMWSGIYIYWNDSIPPFNHAHEVYRVGIGHWTLFRFFPDWFYTNKFWDIRYKVTKALGYHFFFMWIFAINGICYAAYLLWSKEWKFMIPHKESIKEAIQVTLVDLHLRKGMPAQTKYNGAQRIAYSGIVVMGLGSLLSGMAIYRPTQLHWLTTLLGGYEMARWEHFWLTIGFSGFFLVHVGQVILAGWNNFRAMVSGYELRETELPSIEAERRAF